MRFKLIRLKMLNGRSSKLCNTISGTANFLARRNCAEFYESYVISLARLAAKSMIY